MQKDKKRKIKPNNKSVELTILKPISHPIEELQEDKNRKLKSKIIYSLSSSSTKSNIQDGMEESENTVHPVELISETKEMNVIRYNGAVEMNIIVGNQFENMEV